MPIDYKKYPSNWKTEIRPAILKRAENCCEWCGIPNYCVAQWDGEEEGWFRCGGNLYLDQIGAYGADTYKEAREIVDHWKNCCNVYGYIVIVLTIAHINDPDPMNCDPQNLAALCQRCHNRHDAKMRAKNRKKKLFKNQLTLF